jgi:hypothetical protein
MSLRTAFTALAASLVLAGCMSAQNSGSPVLAAPAPLSQCPAESAVDWEGTLSWVDLEGAAERQAARGRTYEDLRGDDVAVIFYAGPSMTVGRTNHSRIVRRDGAWSMETAESPDSLIPPAPPPLPPPPLPPGAPPRPDPVETYACTGYHYKSHGEPGADLIAAIEGFLGDGCRAHLPHVIPGLLFMRGANGRDCADGAGYRIRIETAGSIENYSIGCDVPGSTAETLRRALESARTPENASSMGPEPAFSVTLAPAQSRYRVAQACREIAEERGDEIDYDDPFQW